MPSHTIFRITTFDARYQLPAGAGTDAVHTNPEYCFAVTRLESHDGLTGTGITLTLGNGNRLVCDAIRMLAPTLLGRPIEELMAEFGTVLRAMADDSILRWLGPHKGVIHLALSSIVNACFDLWAKSRGVPLWKLLLNLSSRQLVALLDLSYLEDVLSSEQAVALLDAQLPTRGDREPVLLRGYPGYDTSVGWMGYDDAKVRYLTLLAMENGFQAFKLKLGSPDEEHDIRRAHMLRECAGPASSIMFDVNQQWTLPQAKRLCLRLANLHPFWIEEPTHPDDIMAHVELAKSVAPVKIAAGEHIPNRVLFKNFIAAGAIHFAQADCTRLAGVSEFLAVSILAKKYGLPIVPHVGDMGQIHQHLVLFNHIALGHEKNFLENIPHLRSHFLFPARVRDGFYVTPQEPGASTDLKDGQQNTR